MPVATEPSATSNALALLMIRVQAGDGDAFHELFLATVGPVGRIARATTRSSEHTAEVVQEVYLYAWQHAHRYDPTRGSVGVWLNTISHRRAVDRVRSTVRAEIRDRQSSLLNETIAPDTADLGIAHHEAGRLRSAVGQLTAAQREAVTATFLDGYTHREAARLLSIPMGTLKSRVRSGLASLRVHLDPVAPA